MLYLKDGLPEEGELVMCTVTSIQHHSVFVKLDEYAKSGMIHISEIAPGRIRNINDYVSEGKVVVCKVLRIHEDKGHIDLSLRRVSDVQKRGKINEIKQEQKAEKIIEFVAKKVNIKTDELFSNIQANIFAKYPTVYECFEDVIITGDNIFNDLKVDKKYADLLLETIKQRIKPPQVEVEAIIKLISYKENGVQIVKDILINAKNSEIKPSIKYSGGGNYTIKLIDEDYKSAEKKLKTLEETLEKEAINNNCFFKFDRVDNK